MEKRVYLCIDLKTFYASVECVERNLDPFNTNLVVADPSRGKGTICLAISPKLKMAGIKNRCRIYEIPDGIEYLVVKPRMKKYIEYSANIYAVYLKYIAKEDIHVYSIDECFLDVTKYLKLYQLNVEELAKKIVNDVLKTTGITATVGIGTNLYLAKVALDITAKHSKNNMGYLNERLYQETLWYHQPLTDFWQIGKGISKRLEQHGIFNMYDLAHSDESTLYQEFGINAQFLVDHAWGKEPTLISDIKAYKPKSNSISSGQVLFEDYNYDDGLLIVKEMVELKCLELIDKHLVTNNITLRISYSKHAVKSTGGSLKINKITNSYQVLIENFNYLYRKTTNPNYLIRKITISFNDLKDEIFESTDLFTDYQKREKEKKIQETILEIKQKYGKNAILKGMNLQNKATTKIRNKLIGGHNGE
ncbi:MAG: DNA repair protein [Thomasclavelia sp.]|uniref:Y-family DNA polymerase n=1 Tax=Thomasclavelia sp. TaxID=3025757 RepID=UPI00399F0472